MYPGQHRKEVVIAHCWAATTEDISSLRERERETVMFSSLGWLRSRLRQNKANREGGICPPLDYKSLSLGYKNKAEVA